MNLTSMLPSSGDPPKIMFSWIDYSFFSIMLGISACIGIYYGYWGNKQNITNQHIIRDKTMGVFPVAMSLIAGYTSGMTMLAVPTDIYSFGVSGMWITVAVIISTLINICVFLPVFLKLQSKSIYKYLELRFDNKIRILASFLSTLSAILYNPIIIYLPALAFSQVTGVNVHLIAPILCIICIFYTTLGELKAVIWTDTFQSLAIALSIVVVVIVGIISAGGFSNIWKKSIEGRRLDMFNFKADATRRDGVLGIIIGGSAQMLYELYLNQGCFQRYTAVPSIRHVKKAIVIYCIGAITVTIFSVFIGLVIFSKYAECDPISTKQILQSDQLVPYYVIDVAGNIPCLPGIFISGVVGAGLSTLSTMLNSLSCTIYEDFISPFMSPTITQTKARNIMKLIIVIIGATSTALVFVIEHLGGVLPLIFSIGAITSGPLLGLFCLGILIPCANSKGALIGGIGSLLFNSWMIIGNQLYQKMGLLEDQSKPSSTEGCNFYMNATSKVVTSPSEPVFILYRIMFWYYTLFGAIVVIIIGVVISWFTKKDDEVVHPYLISPVIHFLFPKGYKRVSLPTRSKYTEVDTVLNFEKDIQK